MSNMRTAFAVLAIRVRLMKALRVCSIAGIMGATVTMPALAQLDSALIGQRIRVEVRDAHRQMEFGPKRLDLRGKLSTFDSNTVTLQLMAGGVAVTVPRSEMLSLAISRGAPGRPESALRGAVGGALIGVLWGFVYLHSPGRDAGNTWEDAIGSGASIGALIGAVAGALSPQERWKRLRAERAR